MVRSCPLLGVCVCVYISVIASIQTAHADGKHSVPTLFPCSVSVGCSFGSHSPAEEGHGVHMTQETDTFMHSVKWMLFTTSKRNETGCQRVIFWCVCDGACCRCNRRCNHLWVASWGHSILYRKDKLTVVRVKWVLSFTKITTTKGCVNVESIILSLVTPEANDPQAWCNEMGWEKVFKSSRKVSSQWSNGNVISWCLTYHESIV